MWLDDPKIARTSAPVLLIMLAGGFAWGLGVLLSRYPGYTFFDTAEVVMWSKLGFQLNVGLHPPLLPWLVHIVDLVRPIDRISLMILAVANMLLAAYAVWSIAKLALGIERAKIALFLYGCLPYATWLSLKFNHNSIMISMWPLTVWAFMAALRQPTLLRGTLFGIAAALGVLGKYYELLLLVATFIASLWWPRRAQFYSSPAPYAAISVFCLLVAPHVYVSYFADHNSLSVLWGEHELNRANPLTYALEPAGPAGSQLAQMLKDNALALLPMIVAFAGIARLQGPTGVPRDRDGVSFDLLCLLCLIPYLSTILLVAVLGLHARGDWTAPILTVLPVVLAGFLGVPTQRTQVVLAWLCIAAIIAIPLGAPLRLYLDFRQQLASAVRPDAEIVRQAAIVWRAGTSRPVGIVKGDLRLGVTAALELPERPPFEGYLRTFTAGAVEQLGVLIFCRSTDETCHADALAQVPQGPTCRLRTRRVMWDQQGPEFQTDLYFLPPALVTLNQTAADAACPKR